MNHLIYFLGAKSPKLLYSNDSQHNIPALQGWANNKQPSDSKVIPQCQNEKPLGNVKSHYIRGA
jgi:hypothetical protein